MTWFIRNRKIEIKIDGFCLFWDSKSLKGKKVAKLFKLHAVNFVNQY